ncbi:MAG: S8 family serine peptidase [Alteromonadales bacterium]|nr:S8 family serine peptidase [Alteromonadales bacterium]
MAVTCSIGSSLALATPGQLVTVDADKRIDNQYIVVFKQAPVSIALQGQALVAQTEVITNEVLNLSNAGLLQTYSSSVIQGMVVTADEQQLAVILENPSVDFVEEDQIVSIDPLFSAEAVQTGAIWGLDRIDQHDLPLNGSYNYNFTGSNVTAYVIDTGVNVSHNEFGGRASHGWDFVDNDNNATDCNGHGTHVAGTVAGNSYGVAKNVNVVGVRVLGCTGSGSNSGVIAGINWVANNATGTAVANMSLGGGASSATDRAVNNAVAKGVTFVVAAGNDSANACNYSPARAENAITVGSTTSSDRRSSFSNYGNCLDIYAPGSSIKSAWHNSNTSTKTISGTSMASPHVAGVAALILQENPNYTPVQVSTELSNRATKGKISDAKTGSPNKLLYSLKGDIIVDPDPVDGLKNGVPISSTGKKNDENFFTVNIPQGTASLNISINGGMGDADLYVKYGSKPSTSNWECRPYLDGNVESCQMASVKAGTYHVMLHGWQSFSNVKLTASWGAQVAQTSACQASESWSSKISYSPGDHVTQDRNIYKSLHWSTNSVPGSAAAWSTWEVVESCSK